MLFKNLIGAQMSGSVGGIVASHNAGGAYFRIRATPTNPNSPQQVLVRAAFASLSVQWVNGLIQGQRDTWDTYAGNVPVVNRIGEQVNVSGLSMFVRNNTARVAQGIPAITDAPVIFTNAPFLPQGVSAASEAAQTVDVPFLTIPLTAPWAEQSDSFLLVYVSAPQNVTINFFKGPFRFAGAQEGDATPPASPFVVNAPIPILEGQKLFVRQQVVQADGRISGAFISSVIIAA